MAATKRLALEVTPPLPNTHTYIHKTHTEENHEGPKAKALFGFKEKTSVAPLH